MSSGRGETGLAIGEASKLEILYIRYLKIRKIEIQEDAKKKSKEWKEYYETKFTDEVAYKLDILKT